MRGAAGASGAPGLGCRQRRSGIQNEGRVSAPRRARGQGGPRSRRLNAPGGTRAGADRPPLLLVPVRGGPYLQAVGAWRRRRLVRLEEDLLAPPEELDNSDEDVVQHQDHARSCPPARPPARPLRSVGASATASPGPRSVLPAPPRTAHSPPPGRPAPPIPPATLDSTSRLVRPSDTNPTPPPALTSLTSPLSSLPDSRPRHQPAPSLRSRLPPLCHSFLHRAGLASRSPSPVRSHPPPCRLGSPGARPAPHGRAQ